MNRSSLKVKQTLIRWIPEENVAGESYGGYEQAELCIHATIFLHDGTKATSKEEGGGDYLGLDF